MKQLPKESAEDVAGGRKSPMPGDTPPIIDQPVFNHGPGEERLVGPVAIDPVQDSALETPGKS